jgi:hypothetical protein
MLPLVIRYVKAVAPPIPPLVFFVLRTQNQAEQRVYAQRTGLVKLVLSTTASVMEHVSDALDQLTLRVLGVSLTPPTMAMGASVTRTTTLSQIAVSISESVAQDASSFQDARMVIQTAIA